MNLGAVFGVACGVIVAVAAVIFWMSMVKSWFK